MANNISDLTKSINDLSAQMENFSKQMGKTTAPAAKTIKQVDDLNKSMRNGNISAKDYAKGLADLGKNAERLKKLHEISEEVDRLTEAFVKGDIAGDKYARRMKELGNEAGSTASKFEKFKGFLEKAKKVLDWGQARMEFVRSGTLIKNEFKAIHDSIMKFNTTLYETSRTAKVTGQNFGSLKKSMEEINKSTQMSRQEAAEFVETFAKGIVGAKLSGDAMSNLAKTMSSELGYAQDKVIANQKMLIDLQNKGANVIEALNSNMSGDEMASYLVDLEDVYGATADQADEVLRLMDAHKKQGKQLDETEASLREGLDATKALDKSQADLTVTIGQGILPVLMEEQKAMTAAADAMKKFAESTAGLAIYKGAALKSAAEAAAEGSGLSDIMSLVGDITKWIIEYKVAKSLINKAVGKTGEKVAEKGGEKVAEKGAEKVAEKGAEKVAEKGAEKAAEKGAEKVAERVGETFLEKYGPKLLLRLIHFQGGGTVPGTGSTDSVPTMLTPGEFVVNKKAAMGAMPFLESLNKGSVPKGFEGGGIVGKTIDVGKTFSANTDVKEAGTDAVISTGLAALTHPSVTAVLPKALRFLKMAPVLTVLLEGAEAIYKVHKGAKEAKEAEKESIGGIARYAHQDIERQKQLTSTPEKALLEQKRMKFRSQRTELKEEEDKGEGADPAKIKAMWADLAKTEKELKEAAAAYDKQRGVAGGVYVGTKATMGGGMMAPVTGAGGGPAGVAKKEEGAAAAEQAKTVPPEKTTSEVGKQMNEWREIRKDLNAIRAASAAILGNLQAQREYQLHYKDDVVAAMAATREQGMVLDSELATLKEQRHLAEEMKKGSISDVAVQEKLEAMGRERGKTGSELAKYVKDTVTKLQVTANIDREIVTIEGQKAALGLEQAENLQTRVNLKETETGLMEAQYSLAKSMYMGLGPQMEMQANIVEQVERTKNAIQAQLEIVQKVTKEQPGYIDAQQKAVEYQTKLVQLTQKQFDLVKGLREGYLDAISSFTNVQGAFGKVLTKQDQGMGIMIRQLRAASSMRGGGKGGLDIPVARFEAGTGQLTTASSEATKRLARGRGAPADYADMQALASRGARVTAAGAMQNMSPAQKEAMMHGGGGGGRSGVIGPGLAGGGMAGMTPEQQRLETIKGRGVPGVEAGVAPGTGAEGKEKSDWVKTIAEGINASELVKATALTIKAGAAATAGEMNAATEAAKKAAEGVMGPPAPAAPGGADFTAAANQAKKQQDEAEKKRRDDMTQEQRDAEDATTKKKKDADDSYKRKEAALIKNVASYSKATSKDRVGGAGYVSDVGIGRRGAHHALPGAPGGSVAAGHAAETHAALMARRHAFEGKQVKEETERLDRQKKLTEMATGRKTAKEDKENAWRQPGWRERDAAAAKAEKDKENAWRQPGWEKRDADKAKADAAAKKEEAKANAKAGRDALFATMGTTPTAMRKPGIYSKDSALGTGRDQFKEWSEKNLAQGEKSLAQGDKLNDGMQQISPTIRAAITAISPAASAAVASEAPGLPDESTATVMGGGPIRYAPGGKVPIFGSGSVNDDSVPALLMPGEFVVNKKNARKFGPLLDAMNKNRFAAGGMVAPSAALARGGGGGGSGGGAPQISISVKGDTVGKIMKSVNNQLSAQLNKMLTPCGTTGRSFEIGS